MGGLISLGALVPLLFGSLVQGVPDRSVWSELEQLLASSEPAADRAADLRERIDGLPPDEAAIAHAHLDLRFNLGRTRLSFDSVREARLAPDAAWFLALLQGSSESAPGLARRALLESDDAEYGRRLGPAFSRVLMPAIEAGRLTAARPLAELFYARTPAGWSAQTLALLCLRLGDYDESDRVAAEAFSMLDLPRTERAALVVHRSLVALGRGRERLARQFLGAGLRLGSDDALTVLARLELEGGNRSKGARLAALALDRARREGSVPAAWGLRVFGLSLLRQ